jgi:hypothetical protein
MKSAVALVALALLSTAFGGYTYIFDAYSFSLLRVISHARMRHHTIARASTAG